MSVSVIFKSREFRTELDGDDEGRRLPAIGSEFIFIFGVVRECICALVRHWSTLSELLACGESAPNRCRSAFQIRSLPARDPPPQPRCFCSAPS